VGQELICIASCRVSDFIIPLQQYRGLNVNDINVIVFRWQHSPLGVGQYIQEVPVIIFI
jgi:hypothetical protein